MKNNSKRFHFVNTVRIPLVLLVIVLCFFASAVQIGASGNGEIYQKSGTQTYDGECIHELIQSGDSIPPSCTKEGYTVYICDICGMTLKKDFLPVLGHDFKNYWCTRCNRKADSRGLEFTSLGDGKCELSGIGKCKDDEIVIPSLSPDNEIVVSIAPGAFSYCESLKSIVIPESVREIGKHAFFGCTNLQLAEFDGGVENIGDYAFSGCTKLSFICLPDSLRSLGMSAFLDCSSLVRVETGNSLQSIGKYAFYNCSDLKSAELPDSLISLGEGAFYKCTSLESISIPSQMKKISGSAFYMCISLKCIVIHEGVSSIGNSCFFGCSSINEMILPSSISEIDSNAFVGCSSLEKIYFHGDAPSVKRSTSAYKSFDNTVTLVYSPQASLWQTPEWYGYKTDVWSDGCRHIQSGILTVSEASCTQNGEKELRCRLCNTVLYTEVIEKTGHFYKNGFCLFCNDKDPDSSNGPKYGLIREGGNLYFYINDQKISGWITYNGRTFYANKNTFVISEDPIILSSKQYLWNNEKGHVLANGFYENVGKNTYATLDISNGKAAAVTVSTNGTICFENGYLVYGWRHADGSSVSVVDGVYEQYSANPQNLYYFLSSTYTMVTSDSYVLGGWTREFNADHTVKPLDGLQNRYGEVYYYVAGTMQDGWQTIDGNTYYFYKGTGKAATKWMIIGEKVYYFYAGSSATPYVLKTSGAIGGINYTYAEDGSITTTGFFNTAYANAANNNAAAYIQYKDGTTMYYENGVRVEGWAQIGGNWYYFYKGTGLMCTESRTIGGVWYEFTADGICTSKQLNI